MKIQSEHYFKASHGAGVAPFDCGFYKSSEQRCEIQNAELPSVLNAMTVCVIVFDDESTSAGWSVCHDGQVFDGNEQRKRAKAHALANLEIDQ